MEKITKKYNNFVLLHSCAACKKTSYIYDTEIYNNWIFNNSDLFL